MRTLALGSVKKLCSRFFLSPALWGAFAEVRWLATQILLLLLQSCFANEEAKFGHNKEIIALPLAEASRARPLCVSHAAVATCERLVALVAAGRQFVGFALSSLLLIPPRVEPARFVSSFVLAPLFAGSSFCSQVRRPLSRLHTIQ